MLLNEAEASTEYHHDSNDNCGADIRKKPGCHRKAEQQHIQGIAKALPQLNEEWRLFLTADDIRAAGWPPGGGFLRRKTLGRRLKYIAGGRG
jgi:hypothetical protein